MLYTRVLSEFVRMAFSAIATDYLGKPILAV